MKHIKLKYFSEFELYDEGGYWESDDENVLRQQFDKYEFLLNAVWGALQDFQHKDRETPGSLADRLERFLRERLSDLSIFRCSFKNKSFISGTQVKQ